jgi:hypothetical protein
LSRPNVTFRGLPLESAIEHAVSSVLVEAFDEAAGLSKRNWALMLLAFTFGVGIAAVLVIRIERRRAANNGGDATTTPDSRPSEGRAGGSSKTSAWASRRAQLARADAEMRVRVGHAASRLNIPRQRHLRAQQLDDMTESPGGSASR